MFFFKIIFHNFLPSIRFFAIRSFPSSFSHPHPHSSFLSGPNFTDSQSKVSRQSVISEIKRTNFGNQKTHLRNQTDKFWKSKNSFAKSNATNFGNQTRHLRNQTDKFWKSKVSFEKSNATNFGNQTDKFWKSKVSFEKSNATNFGNQKCHLRNQTRQILEIKRTNFGNQKCHLRNQTDKFWKSNVSFEKSNAINS